MFGFDVFVNSKQSDHSDQSYYPPYPRYPQQTVKIWELQYQLERKNRENVYEEPASNIVSCYFLKIYNFFLAQFSIRCEESQKNIYEKASIYEIVHTDHKMSHTVLIGV